MNFPTLISNPAGRWLASGLLTLLVLPGCVSQPALADPSANVAPYQPRNFAGDIVLPATLRRVVLLPVCTGGIAPPETADMLDRVLLAALQKQTRFEVVTLSREESRLWFGAAEFSSASALPPDYLGRLAAKFAAEGVLFVDLTVYQPYRPLAVGFRAKLALTAGIRITWTFDEVISAGDPGVAVRARREYQQADRTSGQVDLSPTVLQSPGRFAAFAAGAMFQTLPPR
ncbi:MAG: hypothetical protein PSV13_10780 [Lacunisphaera sp.]|nr:hypothetical protein [Lacunisphaera sp.]